MCKGQKGWKWLSEWRTNPFGHIVESNTKYQNLIISIIIFIIFIHFLPARLNVVSLSSSPPSTRSLCSFFCTLVYTPPTGDMWACQSCWLTALKWPTEKQLIFSLPFSFFLVRRCAGDAGSLSGNPIYWSFSERKGLPLMLTDSSQICRLWCRDFL